MTGMEPPAETQQEARQLEALAHGYLLDDVSAARPSADAETLRRVRELADELGRDSWNVTADPVTRERTHIAARIRAALDGTR